MRDDNRSPSATAPMIFELTAKPTHPSVITMPIAVAVPRGNVSPVIASVVGNTGAMLRPAQKTAVGHGCVECKLQHRVSRDRHQNRRHQRYGQGWNPDQYARHHYASQQNAEGETVAHHMPCGRFIEIGVPSAALTVTR